jgi:hypothetical protein
MKPRPPVPLSEFMVLARLERGPDLDAVITRFRDEPDRSFTAADFYRDSGLAPGPVHKLLDKLARVALIDVRREDRPELLSATYTLNRAGRNFVDAYLQAAGDD